MNKLKNQVKILQNDTEGLRVKLAMVSIASEG